MFGEDPFDRIVREFFGEGRGLRESDDWIRGEEEERNIDIIQTNDYVYAVFELPGYSEKDIDVTIKGNELRISAKASLVESADEYISQKLSNGVVITKFLPKYVEPKGYNSTFRNGVLELCFKKK